MDEASRAGRGGARPGAGRKPKNASPIPDADLRAALAAPPPDDIEAVAGQHAGMAPRRLGQGPDLRRERDGRRGRRQHYLRWRL
jgi:hypothetical protein